MALPHATPPSFLFDSSMFDADSAPRARLSPKDRERLCGQFDLLESRLSVLAESDSDGPTESLANDLLIFIAAAAEAGATNVAETARTVLSFLLALDGHAPVTGDRDQLRLLIDILRRELHPEIPSPPSSIQLVTPIAPSGPTDRHTIFLYLDSRAVTELLRAALIDAGFAVAQLTSMSALSSLAADQQPAAIIADLSRCQSDPDTVTAIRHLREGPHPAHLLCLSSNEQFSVRLEAVRLGATRFLKKPVDIDKLLAILNGVTARRLTEPFRVLLVDDDRAMTDLYAEILRQTGFSVKTCNQPLAAPDLIASFTPDVVVTDVYMPGCNGLELAALIRQDERLTDTPILFLSSEVDVHRQMTALDLGADDFLTKPVPIEVFRAAVVARAKRARMLKRTRREQAAISERLKQMELAVEAHSIICITDARGVVLHVNARFCELSGYRRNELIGHNLRLLKSGLHDAAFYEQIWLTVSRGESWQGQICNRNKAGELYWLEATIVPQFDDEGTPIRYISAATDVTPLRRMQATLEATANRLHSIMAVVGDVIFLLDLDGRLVEANPALVTLLGYLPGDVKGRRFLAALSPESRHLGRQALHLIRQNGRLDLSIDLLRADGRRVPVSVHANIGDIGGQPHIIGTLRDMTTYRAAEQELITAKLEAEQASRVKSEFLASMSHELRTPLNSIIGFTQLMRSDPVLAKEPRYGEHVDIILKAAWHLLDLINEVLDLAKIETGHLAMTLEDTPLADFLNDCLVLLQPLAKKRGVQLHPPHTPDAGPVVVRVDRVRLKQIVLNLVSNAIKYNRDDGEVRITIGPDAGHWRISVTDTGPGIPLERQGELFLPFSRLAPDNYEVEGAGIGLALSKRLVELMGGQIGLISRAGAGSTFWFSLPTGNAEAIGLSAPPTPARMPAPARGSVLYIEDSANNAALVGEILVRRPRIRLQVAPTGALGLELAQEFAPDLILLDWHLPDLPGEEVALALANHPTTAAIPVIVLTADALPAVRQAALAAGVKRFITKPFEYETLLDAVDQLLDTTAALPQPPAQVK